MPSLAPFLRQIQAHYPALVIKSARPIPAEQGQFNTVLIVNEALVFRFPRYARSLPDFAWETAVLRHLQPFVSKPVPNPIYTGPAGGSVGEVFMGYAMLPGEPLWHDAFQRLSPAQRTRLAHQLAAFLRSLHATPTADLPHPAPQPNADGPAYWHALYTEFERVLFPHMRPDARQDVVAAFDDYFSNTAVFHYTPCLRHGDFGSGNLLHNPDTGDVTGIIDFGFVGLGDPAVDAAPMLGLGEGFYDAMTAVYPDMAGWLPRITFYRSTFALQEALHGAKEGDAHAFERGIAAYR